MFIGRDKRYAMSGNKCEKRAMDMHVYEGEFANFGKESVDREYVLNIPFLSDNKGHVHLLQD